MYDSVRTSSLRKNKFSALLGSDEEEDSDDE